MKILVTDAEGAEHELEGLDGWRAMEVIRDWGLSIKAECGGACSCATCHVYVGEGWLEKLSAPSGTRRTYSTRHSTSGRIRGCPARSCSTTISKG